MEHFDVTHAPLEGVHLVEANAGTGKTFNISSLVVRLIAEGALDLKNILVLTFTEAATIELRARIQHRCREVLELFEAENEAESDAENEAEATEKTKEDHFLAYCKNRYEQDPEAQKCLQEAVTTFDEANISTIHGFCQGLLRSYPFQFDVRPDFELVPNPSLFILDVIREFWRVFHTPNDHPMIQRMQYLFSELGKGMNSPEKVYDGLKDAFQSEHELHPSHPLWISYQEHVNGTISLQSLADFLEVAERTKKAKADYVEADWHKELQHIITQYWVVQIRGNIRAEKESKGLLDYDDLIRIVSKGIQEANEDFIQLVQSEYRVALIDEFQDTDEDQFAIFQRLYTNSGTLYLIGDPKQAIYGFRGADIHTYMGARNWVPASNRYKLSYNYRSNPELLGFTNELFSSALDKDPFIIKIDYQDSLHPTQKSNSGDHFNQNQASSESHYSNHIWIQKNKDLHRIHPIQMVEIEGEGVEETNEAIKQDVVRRIKELLKSPLIRTSTSSEQWNVKPFKASDIAILVHKNRDAQDIQTQLKLEGIEAIINSQQSIFTTEEAQYILHWLQVIQDPSKERLINTILAHRLSVLNTMKLQELQTDDAQWARMMEQIQQAHTSLSKQKIHSLLQTLFQSLGIWAAWTKLDDFERVITNIEHLFEIINTLQQSGWMGISSLINYLHAQSTEEEDELALDEDVIRLNTDEDMVHIITAHRSKGLQYPVIFCPYSSSGRSFELTNKITKYRKDNKQMIDLRMVSKSKEIHLESAIPMVTEEIASNIRLCYVSITRAESVCFLYTHTGARGWNSGLLASQMDKAELVESIDEKLIKPRTKNLPADGLAKQEVSRLMERFAANNALYTEPMDQSACWYNRLVQESQDLVPTTGVESTQELNYASFERQEMVNNYEQVHSYSSIKRLKERFSEGAKAFTSNSFDAAKDYQDFDDLADDLAENTVADSAGVDQEIKQTTKMLGGTELGSFYHRIMEDLLEKWCLNEFDYKEWVMLEAKNFGLNLHQQGQFFSWVDRMMKVPLVNGFSLSALKKDQLIIEKPFFLSVKPYQVDALYKLIRSKEGFEMPPLHSDQSQLNSVYQDSDLLQGVLTDETPSFNSIPAGFLKGFIDLSFEYEDTYYILDYKTNFLQGNNAYSSDSLNNQMIKLSYDIQGHLYSLAMHKFLATCKHDYSYQEHFGGYFYVFVRGLSTDNKMSGVHFYRPSEQRMKTMEVIVNGKQ